MKLQSRWHSARVQCEVSVVRWGESGVPLLLFPTAGGDAEEIERFHLVNALSPQLAAGRVKIYSCDSVAGRAMIAQEGSPAHRCWLMNQFHDFVRHEVVPAIRTDCRHPDLPVIAAGASIGAFHALAMVCRYPDVFRQAICLSGTYDLVRFLHGEPTRDLYFASPVHFLPGLEGPQLAAIQRNFVIFASGEGRAEDIGESWRAANILGKKGIPNRVDSWGADWHHDWPTWRAMLPRYVDEMLARGA